MATVDGTLLYKVDTVFRLLSPGGMLIMDRVTVRFALHSGHTYDVLLLSHILHPFGCKRKKTCLSLGEQAALFI